MPRMRLGLITCDYRLIDFVLIIIYFIVSYLNMQGTVFKSLIVYVSRFVFSRSPKEKRTYAVQRLHFYTRTLSRAINPTTNPSSLS